MRDARGRGNTSPKLCVSIKISTQFGYDHFSLPDNQNYHCITETYKFNISHQRCQLCLVIEFVQSMNAKSSFALIGLGVLIGLVLAIVIIQSGSMTAIQ